MNWQRGLLRIWIVASVGWVILVAWMAYNNVAVPRQQARLDYSRCLSMHPGNGAVCLTDAVTLKLQGREPAPTNTYTPYAAMAAAGPLAMIAGWFCFIWVGSGFKGRNSSN
jgi:hypothetical protein